MRYLDYDGSLLYRYIINAGEDAIDPIVEGYISAPKREDTETANYTFIGWSELPINVQKAYNIIAKYDGIFRIDFCDLEGNILNSQWVNLGKDAIEPVSGSLIETPKKPSTVQYNYEFSGWDHSYKEIKEPLILKPVFEAVLCSYRVFFMNDTKVLQESLVLYGNYATFTGDTTTIKKVVGGEESIYYEFSGWSPNPDKPIIGNTWYYAEFVFDGYIRDSWSTIAAAASSGDVGNYGIGGRKILKYTTDGQNYSTVELEIVGKNHDILVSPSETYNNGANTATLSFVCKVLSNEARVMNGKPHSANGNSSLSTGGWTVSELREWMNSTLFAALPIELQQAIKPVIKKSDGGFFDPILYTTEDTLWIPSDRELNCENVNNVIPGQGEPYVIYTDANSRIKSNAAEGISIYWTRTTGREGQHFYRYIDSSGYPGNLGAANKAGIAWGFCI